MEDGFLSLQMRNVELCASNWLYITPYKVFVAWVSSAKLKMFINVRILQEF